MPTTTEINWELLDKCMDFITSKPERWNQKHFAYFLSDEEEARGNLCGTQFCLAGTACFVAKRVRIDEYDRWMDNEGNEHVSYAIVLLGEDGDEVGDNWFDAGMELLGITANQARIIFGAQAPLDVDEEVWNDPVQYKQFVYNYLGDTRNHD